MKTYITLLFTFIYFFGYSLKPDSVYISSPEALGLDFEAHRIQTTNNLTLQAWVLNPMNEIDLETTLVLTYGDAGNMSYQQLHHAQYFTSKGFNVVTFDWRGFGESSKWDMNIDYLVYSELLLDYDAVIKEVIKQKVEVDTAKIAVYGWSTGAYLSMAAASKYDNIKAFVGIGLMTSFDEVVPVLKKSKNKQESNLIVPDDYPKEMQPICLAPNYNKSTFLIVGEKDERTPVWMSEQLYSLLPAKKELWIVKDAEHGGQKGPLRDFDVFHKRVLDFLETNLK